MVRLGLQILIFIDPRDPFNRSDIDPRREQSYHCFLKPSLRVRGKEP